MAEWSRHWAYFVVVLLFSNSQKPKDISPEMKSQKQWIRELFLFHQRYKFPPEIHGCEAHRSSYQATTYYNLQPTTTICTNTCMYINIYVYWVNLYIMCIYNYIYSNWPQPSRIYKQHINFTTYQPFHAQCPGTGTWWRSLQPLSPYAQSFPGSLEHWVSVR